MRIAIVGGADYNEAAFEDFLYALNRKYPDAVIVTGTAVGKNEYRDVPGQEKRELVRPIPSAERMAESILTGLGHTVVIPDLDTPTYQYLRECKMSPADLQLGAILNGTFELRRTDGTMHHHPTSPRPDVIVAVGNPDSARARAAADHWKRMDAWRDKENQRPFHSVAAPPVEKKAKKYKAKKKKHLLAA